MKHSKTVKRISTVLKVIVLLAMACAANAALCFALIPYGSKSEVMWLDYEKESDLDTVVMGDSLLENGFNPAAVDEIAGTKSFNMCTPAQKLEESLLGVKRAVADNSNLRTVIFGVTCYSLQETTYTYPGRAYTLYKDKSDPQAFISDTLQQATVPEYFDSKYSLNWMFPWLYNHVALDSAHITRNVQMRHNDVDIYEAAMANENGWLYKGKGFGCYDKVLNYDKGASTTYASRYGRKQLNSEKMETLVRMAEYCESRGIDFIVVNGPLPAFSIMDCGQDYEEKSETIREAVEGAGGEYYDYCLAKKRLFDAGNHTYFRDFEHLNLTGATAFSESIGRLLKFRNNGTDTEPFFYKTYDEWLKDHQTIEMVKLTSKDDGDGVVLQATAIAPPDLKVEYRFSVLDEQTNKYVVLRSWTNNPEYLLADKSEAVGKRYRVDARIQGEDVSYDRYRTVMVKSS